MEVIAIIISLAILIGLVKLLSPVKSTKLTKRSYIQIEVELELTKIELTEIRSNVTLIEYRRKRYPYSNLPKRYYDYIRKIEYLTTKIQLLEAELKHCPANSTLFYSKEDSYFLNSHLSALKAILNNSKGQLDEMKFHFEGTKTPKGWYEAKEVFDLYEKKFNFISGKITDLEKIRRPFQSNPFSQSPHDIS